VSESVIVSLSIAAAMVAAVIVPPKDVSTAHIGALQVTLAKMAADSVDKSKLADNAVDSEHYVDGSIDNAHIADDQIDSEHYVDGSVDNAHLANDGITICAVDTSLGGTITAATIAAAIDSETMTLSDTTIAGGTF